MRYYTHKSYSYVTIVEIPKNEISKVDFAKCAEPRETLGSFYNRQSVKPDVIVNAGFFVMATGKPCFNNIDEGTARSTTAGLQYGMGNTKENKAELKFGNVKDGTEWNDFLSAYPVLLDGNGAIKNFSYATEINYNATRSILAYNDDYIFIVEVGLPGMKFETMSDMLDKMGCKYAINLDGGGSARCLVKGKAIGSPTENRRVDNVFCVYLKQGTNTSTVNHNGTTDSSVKNGNTIAADAPYITYIAKTGDSWWKIAKEQLGNGSKYKELMAFNNVSTSIVKTGMKIKIPCNDYEYTVAKGDTWWGIASREMGSGTKYKKLAEYNKRATTSTLIVGEKLRIPV